MAAPEPPEPDHGFIADVRWAIGVLRRDPRLPAIALVINVTFVISEDAVWSLIFFPIALFGVGWVGAERIWFLRASRGGTLGSGEVLTWVRRLFWPIVRLGLFGSLMAIPFVVVAMEFETDSLGQRLVIAALGIFVDVLFTFAPALVAFHTRSARTAIRAGWRMIKMTWPASAPYVITPAVTLTLIGALWFPGAPWWLRVGLTISSTLAGLVAKGATVAFYVRLAPIEGEGPYGDPRVDIPVRPDGPDGIRGPEGLPE